MATLEQIINALPHMEETLLEMGINVDNDPNFLGTADRWLKYLQEYTQPFDIKECLSKTFPSSENGFHPMVVQSHIPFEAVCAHHLVPVLGIAHIGYVPNERVVGLSKITRLIHGISHSVPSLQETIGDQVVDALCEHLNLNSSTTRHSCTVPEVHSMLIKEINNLEGVEYTGAMCVIQAEHGCMACRGIKRPGVITSTSSIRGCFLKPEARAEFYNLIASRRSLG